MENLKWFLCTSLLSILSCIFGDFWRLLGESFVRQIWRRFLSDFFEGITYEYLVTLFLVILHPQTPGIAVDSKFFGWTLVLEVEARDLRFPMIKSDLVDILWIRGCSGGNPSISKVWLQSVGWISRSINAKLRVCTWMCCLGRPSWFSRLPSISRLPWILRLPSISRPPSISRLPSISRPPWISVSLEAELLLKKFYWLPFTPPLSGRLSGPSITIISHLV